MDINIAFNKILKNTFSVSYKNGFNHFRDGNVNFTEIKKIDNFTNIYGRVNDNSKMYNTHIRINNDNNKIQLICNCDFSKEVRAIGGNLPCEHIIATALKLNNENNKVNLKGKEESIKVFLRIEQVFNEGYNFRAYLFLDGRGRIKISSKSELDYNVFKDEGLYSIKKIKYSKENRKLFKLLSEMNFKISEKDIRNLLFFSANVNFSIKVDSIEYEGKIIKEELPLKFTLKNEDNKIRLQTIKSPIKALNEECTVFIYDRKVYIPPLKQCKLYLPIYKVLNKKYYTYVKESSLNKVIKVLKSIGELNINEDLANLIAEEVKFKLAFYKEDNNIVASLDIASEKQYLQHSNKVKSIEEILFLHKFTKRNNKYYFLGEDEELYDLLNSELNNYCYITSSEEIGDLGILSYDILKGEAKINKKGIEFNLSIDGIEKNQWEDAINNYIEGKDFYKFNNNSFLDFRDSTVSDLMELFRFINFKGEAVTVPIGYEELLSETIGKNNLLNIIKLDEEEDILIKRKPRGLQGTLREYQKAGLQWFQNKKNKGLFGILADEMGLGKTIQTISFILQNRRDKTMVITPTSLVYNWEAEFKKFAPTLKVAVIHGSKSKRMNLIKNISKYNVILTSYGTLNMDIDLYKDITFDNLIIDEGQTIKNPKAKITESVKSIKSNTRFALTGTPFENNYLELWSIFDFLKPGYLFSEREFKEKFLCNTETQIQYLKLAIKPFILRRTKSEVLKELPNKVERTFYVEMTDEQKKYYKSSLKKYIKESKETNNHISILSFLTRLRQIALDPSIIDNNYSGGSGKIKATLEIISKALENDKKILIFSQFTSLLDKLKNELDSINIKYYYLDGATKANNRIKLCRDFNEDNEIKIFLISLKAGGTGLNLTSAQTVIHFDPWWNPAVENQATDRAHRIGQKKEVEVIKIISKDTIEEKIIKLKEEKSKIFAELLDDDIVRGIKDTKLTKDEIEYLLTEEI